MQQSLRLKSRSGTKDSIKIIFMLSYWNRVRSLLLLAMRVFSFPDRTIVAACANAVPKRPARILPCWCCWLNSTPGRCPPTGRRLRRSRYQLPNRCYCLWNPVRDCSIPENRRNWKLDLKNTKNWKKSQVEKN